MGAILTFYDSVTNNTMIRKRNKKGFGWVPDIPDNRDIYAIWKPSLTEYESIDLRKSVHMPAVYNQGELGSCTANAIGAAYVFQNKNLKFKPSRLFIYYNEREIEGTTGVDSGASIRDGIKSINKIGVCPESVWPYNIDKFSEKPSDCAYLDAEAHKLIEYRRVAISIQEVQKALNNNYSVIFGMTVYESFMSIDNSGIMQIPKISEKIIGGHAIMIVGYNKTHFIVRNSWGEEWGDYGYFYLPFEVFRPSYCSDAWILISDT